MEVGVKKAKDQLSQLLLRVIGGDEIIITRKGVPIARLVGIEPKPGPRKLGTHRGKIWIADDFDAPLMLVEDCSERNRKKH